MVPAPLVVRSDLIVVLPEMVVLRPNVVLESFANSKVPPERASVPPPRALATVPRNVPAERVTAPVKPELSPERINLPGPDMVRPLVPESLAEIVAVSPELVTAIAFAAALAPARLIRGVPEPGEIVIPAAPKVIPALTVTVLSTVTAALAVSKTNAPELA